MTLIVDEGLAKRGDKLSTAKANMPKIQLYRPDAYSLSIWGDYYIN
jgi:hypothetical protein